MLILIQGDNSGWEKPPVYLDLGCPTILPGQLVASVAAHQLLEVPELSQWEVFIAQNGHPAPCTLKLKQPYDCQTLLL